MKETSEIFKKDNRLKLFGHEDAGKEDDSRLTSYYYKVVPTMLHVQSKLEISKIK